ncbi:MAG: hypothetical protein KAJ19_02940 [Gammaproteobacteria bacterium]|nr:hypothetical protein [Gammaproteobacteria bacterium]
MVSETVIKWDADGWDRFLKERAYCIRSMRNQGISFEEIVSTLNLSDISHAERIYIATSSEADNGK